MANLRTNQFIPTVISTSTTAPAAPSVGQRWYKPETGITYQYTANADGTTFWLDITSGGIGTSVERGVDFVGDADPHHATNLGVVGSVYYNREKNRHFVCTTATSGSQVWSGGYAGAGGITYTYTYGGTNYRLHVFKQSDTFHMEDSSLSCDALIVAGGGGGGWGTGGRGGGGGAGGLRFKTNSAVTVGDHAIVVGVGGVEALGSTVQGSDGGNSSGLGFTSTGGGGGASASSQNGRAGGSGGGAAMNNTTIGAGNAGSHTPVEGFAGGLGSSSFAGGGGGGSSAVGTAGTGNNVGGNGGDGSSTFITNAATTAAFLFAAKAGTNAANAVTSGLGSNPGTLYIAGGGGGSTDASSNGGGLGGKGGGGRAVGSSGNVQPLVNTGSGGHAQQSGVGDGSGSSGIVIVRYVIN